MMKELAEIVSNRVVAPGYYKMTLSSLNVVKSAKPGQFIHVRVTEGYDPLLRRPMSIHRVEERGKFSILYRVIGRGTKLLSEKKSGENIDLVGPLGKGFGLDEDFDRAIMIAGGIGVAPLMFLAQKISSKIANSCLLIGAKTKDELLAVSDFKNMGCKVVTTTEDGSSGRKGFVSDVFEKALVDPSQKGSPIVYACGPRDMLARIVTISKIYSIRCQVSLEEMMACGVGACLSCVVETESGKGRVCADGPVFEAGDIIW